VGQLPAVKNVNMEAEYNVLSTCLSEQQNVSSSDSATVIMVTICECSLHPINQPNPVDSHSHT
jgi:hypothetical protein